MSMMRLSEAARAIPAELRGEDREFDKVSTDTRALPPRALFVALRGARYDGHHFLAQAAEKGAAGALVEMSRIADRGSRIDLPLLVVDDSRLALGRLAGYWRSRFSMPLVALTGSNGKTTVKEMLASILREAVGDEPRATGHELRVLATRGNLNNDIGVPLTLLELESLHRYAVIEMGMNHEGEIRYLSRLAKPDVALVTNAGPAHIEFLCTIEAIAHAKGEIFEGLGPDGTAVINADDRHAGLWRECASGRRVVEFGIEQPAAVSASYRLKWLESEIVVKTPLGDAATLLQAPGVHNVRNALAASAAAVALEIPAPAIARGLGRFKGIAGRMQKKPALNGATLIDDTYNANPESARAAIAVLALAPGQKMLVLGDMGELGTEAPQLHAETGEYARKNGVDRLYTLGELSAHASRAFGPGARHFARIEDLLAELGNALGADVTVLVKGSRFMKMERVVAALAATGEEKAERGEEAKP